MQDLSIVIPSKWPDDIENPWLEGEASLEKLCERFKISLRGLIPSYREYVADPRKVPELLNSTVLQEILSTIPISSCEAERGFSQMNLVCTDHRVNLLIRNIASLLFISINGPPPHLRGARTTVRLQRPKAE